MKGFNMKLNTDKVIAALLRRSGSSLCDLAAADCETLLTELKSMAKEAEHEIGCLVPRKPFDSHTGDESLN
jgi:hypothetical protein